MSTRLTSRPTRSLPSLTTAAALVAALVFAPATPVASDDTCLPEGGRSFDLDYAWTEDPENRCALIFVRHEFIPPGEDEAVWTDWRHSRTDHVRTERRPELVDSQHGGWV